METIKNTLGTTLTFLTSYGFTFAWTLIAAGLLLLVGQNLFGGIALGWFISTNIEAIKRLIEGNKVYPVVIPDQAIKPVSYEDSI